jgi:hypothetical protein
MCLVKATFVYAPAIALIALLGGIDSGKAADTFQTDDFSGTVNFNQGLVMPAGPPLFSLNYTGVTTFDETKVSKLPFNPKLGKYNSFIHDGGSLSVTLDLPFGIITLTPPANSPPTMVVEDSKPVAFDFAMTRTVNIPFGETVKLTLNVNAPIPNPVMPGLNPNMYTGVLENVTLSAVFSGAFSDKESLSGTTIPTFVVVPEPGSLVLLCIGTVIVGLAYLRVQRRACFSFSNC